MDGRARLQGHDTSAHADRGEGGGDHDRNNGNADAEGERQGTGKIMIRVRRVFIRSLGPHCESNITIKCDIESNIPKIKCDYIRYISIRIWYWK